MEHEQNHPKGFEDVQSQRFESSKKTLFLGSPAQNEWIIPKMPQGSDFPAKKNSKQKRGGLGKTDQNHLQISNIGC